MAQLRVTRQRAVWRGLAGRCAGLNSGPLTRPYAERALRCGGQQPRVLAPVLPVAWRQCRTGSSQRRLPGKGDEPPPLIICGPSGVGKGTLIRHLRKTFPGRFGFSVSHTTRGPRHDEQDGVAYHFTDRETMKRMLEAGEFIEAAIVHGNMYGTSWEAVEAVRRTGKICILDIDVQGARSVRESGLFKGAKFVFILPPSIEELERRLRGRGTDSEEQIQQRMGSAVGELELGRVTDIFDHSLVLDGLIGGNVPAEVQRLCTLLAGWYHELGEGGGQGAVAAAAKAMGAGLRCA